MLSTIPYDPSLVLGNIVPQAKLKNLEDMANLQAVPDSKLSVLNSLITQKRSLDMTIQELIGMKIDPNDPDDKKNLFKVSEEIGTKIKDAAIDYAQAKRESEEKIQPLRATIGGVSDMVESPIDYNKSIIKKMPISADSLQMNVQYFSVEENEEKSKTHGATIASFVSESLSYFGQKQASEAAGTASSHANNQVSRHSISGTLVICIGCTHKNAQVFAPFIMDIDKAVKVWNTLFSGSKIDIQTLSSMGEADKKDEFFQILSGATYGSSFVGMIHVLNTADTTSNQDMESLAFSLQETMNLGGWFATATGSFGVTGSFSDSVKNLLSIQNVQSHCSLVTMGIIPSIKSNKLKMGVQGFANFDPAKEMEQLNALQSATDSANNSISSAADAARTGQKMVALKNETIKATLSGLAPLDSAENNILDTNSMMTAMDDYIQKCIAGGDNLGVPINYYLKPISRSMIVQAWMAKYFPNRFNLAGAIDDSPPVTDTPVNQ